MVNVCFFQLTVSEDAIASLSRFGGVPRRFEENGVVSSLKVKSHPGFFDVSNKHGSFVWRSSNERLDVGIGLRAGKRSIERNVVNVVVVKEL